MIVAILTMPCVIHDLFIEPTSCAREMSYSRDTGLVSVSTVGLRTLLASPDIMASPKHFCFMTGMTIHPESCVYRGREWVGAGGVL